MMPCPCTTCLNHIEHKVEEVQFHLFKYGIDLSYTKWDKHGEKDEQATTAQIPVNATTEFVDDTDFDMDFGLEIPTDGPATVEMVNATKESFDEDDLAKFQELLLDAEKPLYKGCPDFIKLSAIVKLLNLKGLKIMRMMGSGYKKIHVCSNNCILYWKDNKELTVCPTCGISRWKVDNKTHKVYENIPAKAWRTIDEKFPEIAKDPRNLRLGISADGVDVNSGTRHHSVWPVLSVIYNLPPCGFKGCVVCGKDTHCVRLSASSKQSYAGHRRYLPYNHPFRRQKKAFNGQQEFQLAPNPLTGEQIYNEVQHIENKWGKGKRTNNKTSENQEDTRGRGGKIQKQKRKTTEDEGSSNQVNEAYWKKFNIWYRKLRYWRHNSVPHCIDFMHVEKNVCESLVGTLLNVPGKTKDGMNARLDLAELGIKPELFARQEEDKTTLPPAGYTLTNAEKDIFCETLSNIRVPQGYCSNFSSLVSLKDRKLIGLKSHDYHMLMQEKEISLQELDKLQLELVVTLCLLEKFFPPSFFDIMIHLTVHLTREDGKPLSAGKSSEVSGEVFQKAHLYVIQNTDEIVSYIERHKQVLKTKNPGKRIALLENEHSKSFAKWLREEVERELAISKDSVSETVRWISYGPRATIVKYEAYNINGYTFRTKSNDGIVYQNSGVSVEAVDLHISKEVATIRKAFYYGVLQEIWVLDYCFRQIPLFKCDWVNHKAGGVKHDPNLGYTLVDLNSLGHKDDPFILASQARQVFYVKD
ncbi:putative reverse transcriptase domain-containing protein [Tanacetum coccineum]|uniref:Reverse transcriptase domain-containing protein n=1 Tax=Tanacetum coccineum TaxID=301880 RepID=A0ABQ5IXL6_9ASTR